MKYRIKELREKKNLTQEELAEMCGLTRQYMNKVENSDETNISSKTLVKLAEIFGCKVDDIFFESSV